MGISLLTMAALKFVVFCSSAMLMWMRRKSSNCRRAYCYFCSYEAKICSRKLILLLFFSQATPLHYSATIGHLEISRLLVESKADVAARDMCFSPPPSHHLSLTICLAAGAELHSNTPSTATTKPTLPHTCAASARRNDAPPRAAACCARAHAKVNFVLIRVAAAGNYRYGGGGAQL